jgi:D-xylose transport system substrate-binding protein
MSGPLVQKPSGKARVTVLLPELATVRQRWEEQDRRFFDQEFRNARIPASIVNAVSNSQTQLQQARHAIAQDTELIILVSVFPKTSRKIIREAHRHDIPVITYDRIVENGRADYHVSFDPVRVGEIQAEGLLRCLNGKRGAVIAEVNASPSNNNARELSHGYKHVLGPLYRSGYLVRGPHRYTPNGDPVQALAIYNQMLRDTNNHIDGVLAATDALAEAVIASEKEHGTRSLPITGQDATLEAVHALLDGTMCMTVYKAFDREVAATVHLATELLDGKRPQLNDAIDDGEKRVPAIQLDPVAVTRRNLAERVFLDKILTPSIVCTNSYIEACSRVGLYQ